MEEEKIGKEENCWERKISEVGRRFVMLVVLVKLKEICCILLKFLGSNFSASHIMQQSIPTVN